MKTRLYLIRHGITRWNATRRYCGWKDVPLSSDGKAQALRLRTILDGVSFNRMYASDRRRAIQTARILFPRARITKRKGLREINFGVFEGCTGEELSRKYGSVYRRFLRSPFDCRIPRAETLPAFRRRIAAAIKSIVAANEGTTVAVVCHGGAIAVLLSALAKQRVFWRFVPQPASVTIVEYDNGSARMTRFNETAHNGATQRKVNDG